MNLLSNNSVSILFIFKYMLNNLKAIQKNLKFIVFMIQIESLNIVFSSNSLFAHQKLEIPQMAKMECLIACLITICIEGKNSLFLNLVSIHRNNVRYCKANSFINFCLQTCGRLRNSSFQNKIWNF